jgi:RNA polymerase sigma factor FliA
VPTDEERRRLVAENIAYVRALAARIRERLHPHIEMDDLVAYGMQGLAQAAARYDPRQGTRFTTYAYYRVRGAIFDGLRSMGWLSRGEYLRYRFEERANTYLMDMSAETGAADAESDRSVAEVGRAIDDLAAIYVTSLDALQAEPADPRGDALQEATDMAELRDRLHEAIAALPERERRLIRTYYYRAKTLEAVGRELGLSKSWTSRVHAKAIRHLGRALRAEVPPRKPPR